MNKVLFLTLFTMMTLFACGQDDSGSKSGDTVTPDPGEAIVKANCKVCHAQGINGAPVIGNKKMWDDRLDKGIPQLVINASNGFGLMPAKGGKTNLTDEEIRLAVTYMVSQVQ